MEGWRAEPREKKDELTPAQQRSQAPEQRVEPHQQDDEAGSPLRRPANGLQGLGDDDVAVDGDSQQVDHGCYPKQGPTEGIHFTA